MDIAGSGYPGIEVNGKQKKSGHCPLLIYNKNILCCRQGRYIKAKAYAMDRFQYNIRVGFEMFA